MSTLFLIEAENKLSAVRKPIMLPTTDFGDTAIRVVDFYNWYRPEEKPYKFEMFSRFPDDEEGYRRSLKMFGSNTVPIGSVEFALDWFKVMGVDNVKPLNIPCELWKFCDRRVTTGFACDFNGVYMVKDLWEIKSPLNGRSDTILNLPEDREMFFSEWLYDVESEWRVFVFNGEIRDIRCYSGNYWRLPDREYIARIVKEYNNPSYTLDVMVTPKRTEILELHDFFSCGLYGFDDYSVLPLMWKRAVRNILERK